MHQVGKQPRQEYVFDIEEAMLRGVALDQMMQLGNIPRMQGVRRMTHTQMNQEDFERSLQIAKLLNQL